MLESPAAHTISCERTIRGSTGGAWWALASGQACYATGVVAPCNTIQFIPIASARSRNDVDGLALFSPHRDCDKKGCSNEQQDHPKCYQYAVDTDRCAGIRAAESTCQLGEVAILKHERGAKGYSAQDSEYDGRFLHRTVLIHLRGRWRIAQPLHRQALGSQR